uniref:uncharacterized protein LOC124057797 isoform X2 n=1 Tax=Scatophagus argus TaxID=75038 RepID=UPI001ED805E6|nr:uncharacterized protein LOC124057797 isoform X2 [Scatophagus argus]
MLLSNTTGSLTGAVPLSVDFDSPVDYFVFIFQILFATTAVLIAAPVGIAIFSTRALRLQNRYQVERDPPSAEKDSKKESLRIIIFVVISFLVLWCPSFVNIVLRFLTGGGLTFRNEATNPFAILARLSAVCTPAVYLWGSPALREATVRTVWGRVCPRCRRRVGSCSVKGDGRQRPLKIH